MPGAHDFRMLVDGELVGSDRGFEVKGPATGNSIATCPAANSTLLDRAVDAATKAFPAWKATPMADRKELLRKLGTALADHADELAALLTLEQGRPLPFARQEIEGAGQWFHGVTAFDLPPRVVEDGPSRRIEVHWEPLGVVCAIVPWNFPVMLAAWKLAPALLAGNCVVLKPSPYTPLCTLRIGELVHTILPPGVLNILAGTDELGPMMTAHPGFAKISFTGSSATGRRVMESAARDLKAVTLELGGNDPAIVLADNDPEAIADALFFGAFFNSGQICMATKRIYVHDALYDAVRDALAVRVTGSRVGNGLEEGMLFGPVQNGPQFERVKSLLDDCRTNGFPLVSGSVDGDPGGYFLPLTLVDNPPETSRIVTEEAFGPIVPILRFKSIDEVVARANASEYGLGATVWSRDLTEASALAARLECGTVWINHNLEGHPAMTVSGRKQSGTGIENGEEGLRAFAAPKSILIPK